MRYLMVRELLGDLLAEQKVMLTGFKGETQNRPYLKSDGSSGVALSGLQLASCSGLKVPASCQQGIPSEMSRPVPNSPCAL
jgi:hypothetical protein